MSRTLSAVALAACVVFTSVPAQAELRLRAFAKLKPVAAWAFKKLRREKAAPAVTDAHARAIAKSLRKPLGIDKDYTFVRTTGKRQKLKNVFGRAAINRSIQTALKLAGLGGLIWAGWALTTSADPGQVSQMQQWAGNIPEVDVASDTAAYLRHLSNSKWVAGGVGGLSLAAIFGSAVTHVRRADFVRDGVLEVLRNGLAQEKEKHGKVTGDSLEWNAVKIGPVTSRLGVLSLVYTVPKRVLGRAYRFLAHKGGHGQEVKAADRASLHERRLRLFEWAEQAAELQIKEIDQRIARLSPEHEVAPIERSIIETRSAKQYKPGFLVKLLLKNEPNKVRRATAAVLSFPKRARVRIGNTVRTARNAVKSRVVRVAEALVLSLQERKHKRGDTEKRIATLEDLRIKTEGQLKDIREVLAHQRSKATEAMRDKERQAQVAEDAAKNEATASEGGQR